MTEVTGPNRPEPKNVSLDPAKTAVVVLDLNARCHDPEEVCSQLMEPLGGFLERIRTSTCRQLGVWPPKVVRSAAATDGVGTPRSLQGRATALLDALIGLLCPCWGRVSPSWTRKHHDRPVPSCGRPLTHHYEHAIPD